ncbi:MAG: chitinase [Gammaproteobacteria bacterium]|nr:chitinase [Gammaproteobacteria bacterium]
MTIKLSVGQEGINVNTDVKVVQAALNLSQSPKFNLNAKLVVDGKIGDKTIDAIESFQKNIAEFQNPDGRVDPNSKTFTALKKHLTKSLTEDALMAIMAMGVTSTIKTYLPLFTTMLPKYAINTPLRTAHFLAQVGHESLSLLYTQELASGAAYEGRKDLGNIQKGDGVRFKGRGLIQLTGRDNYSQYGKYASMDLLKTGNEQIIASTPKYALDVSLWFWKNKKLNTYADDDNLRAITRRVNGGYNGLTDRQDYLERAKFFLIS